MRRLLAVIVVALALPAAAQAKEITGLAVCGPEKCERVGLLSGTGHDAIDGASARRDGPPPGRFYRLELELDRSAASFSAYYEPESGLVAVGGSGNALMWARLAPKVAIEVKETAKRVPPFPAPTFEGAPAALLTVTGPEVVPKTSLDSKVIRLESASPNPWTRTRLVYHPRDGVLLRGATFVKLPASLAVQLDGRGGGGESVPWIAVATALAGVLGLLLAAWRRAPEGEVAPVN